MRSGSYCPGPGDLGLDELYESERRGPSQRELDAEADAAIAAEIDRARDEWDLERGRIEIDDDGVITEVQHA